MGLPALLQRLALPVIGSPMFIVSTPSLVIEQCKAGIVGSMPSLPRDWFDGPLALSGSIATGNAILAAQAMGADLAYIGSAFIATEEARAPDGYKQMVVEGSSADVVYSNLFTGVHGNYLKGSIRNAGLDPDNLARSDPSRMSFGEGAKKAWKDIWAPGKVSPPSSGCCRHARWWSNWVPSTARRATASR